MKPIPHVDPRTPARDGDVYRTPGEAQAALGSLSRYVSWADAFRASRFTTGIPVDVARAMKVTASTVLDVLIADVGPVRVTSWYREGATLANGRRSSHRTGYAVDAVPLSGSSETYATEAAHALQARGVPWDRLIWYAVVDGGHVHVAYRHPTNSTQELTLRRKVEGEDSYPVIERFNV